MFFHPAFSLPELVEAELKVLCLGRSLPYPDPAARAALAEIGQAAAVRVLRTIGESRQPVRNFSRYIVHMARTEAMVRNARGLPPAEGAACCAGPSVHSRGGEESVTSGQHHGEIHMEVESPNHGFAFGLSNEATMEAQSPDRRMAFNLQNQVMAEVGAPVRAVASIMPNHARIEAESPTSQMSFRLQNQALVKVDEPLPTMAPLVPNLAGMEVDSLTCRIASELKNQAPRVFDSPIRPMAPMAPNNVALETQSCPNALRETASPQMLALGKLEFSKAFMIISYLAEQRIEGELTVDYIESLESLPMVYFESEIWSKFGQKYIAASDRIKNLDWDPSKTRVYHCNIEMRRNSIVKTFKGPYLENTRTHLQRSLGDEHVLIVKFGDTYTDNIFGTCGHCYLQLVEDGIVLGLRRYRFFLYKDGGKEEKKKEESTKDENKKLISSVRCYFVHTESGWDRDEHYILSNKTIDQARRLFMHVHTAPNVAKYMARFALILSKTVKLDVDLSTVKIETIEDKPCKDEHGNVVCNQDGVPLIHTDGTGLISQDLALMCPTSIFKGDFLKSRDFQVCKDIVDNGEALIEFPSSKGHQEHPLLMQFRMFYKGNAVKGTLLVDKRLPCRTIHIRPSMIKIKADPDLCDEPTFNSLEMVSTSNRPNRTSTSKFLIALLHCGGVPGVFFMRLLWNALEGIEKARCKVEHALRVAFNYADMDDSMPAQMILSGIPLDQEPYLQSRLASMTMEERKRIRQGKLPIDDCYYLMGTTDPTGTLKPNEVCVILDHRQLSGDVLVYKHPGLHFGDIHILTAAYIKGLEKIVGKSKYAIFFPTSGPRSLADEMANSDFDGDMYWVSINLELLENFKPGEPWVQRITPKKTEQKRPQHYGPFLERQLFREFLRTRFTPSYALGTAADCWLAYMDRLLTCEVGAGEKKSIENKMLELVDIYYLALDAPKAGMKVEVPRELMVKRYPHFMERKGPSYHSTSVLGKLYDEATLPQIEKVLPIKISLLPCFAEEEVSQACKQLWTSRYHEYLGRSAQLANLCSNENKNLKFQELYQTYKLMLYDAAEFEESPRDCHMVFKEACAIYQIVYAHAQRFNNVGKCGFTWKVAGHALCHLYALKQGGKTMLCSYTVLHKLLGGKSI